MIRKTKKLNKMLKMTEVKQTMTKSLMKSLMTQKIIYQIQTTSWMPMSNVPGQLGEQSTRRIKSRENALEMHPPVLRITHEDKEVTIQSRQ